MESARVDGNLTIYFWREPGRRDYNSNGRSLPKFRGICQIYGESARHLRIITFGSLSRICLGTPCINFSMYVIGLLCIKKKDEPEEEWQAFTESLFLVVKDCFTCCHAAETKGQSIFLPKVFNHQLNSLVWFSGTFYG